MHNRASNIRLKVSPCPETPTECLHVIVSRKGRARAIRRRLYFWCIHKMVFVQKEIARTQPHGLALFPSREDRNKFDAAFVCLLSPMGFSMMDGKHNQSHIFRNHKFKHLFKEQIGLGWQSMHFPCFTVHAANFLH